MPSSSGLKAFSFYNAGQDCTAASRIYAGKGIYEKLVADLSSAASSIRYNKTRRRRERDRPAHLRKAPRARLRLRRSRREAEARRDRDRRQAGRAARASSTSRRSSPARSRRTRSCGARFSGRSSRSPGSPTSSRRSPGRTIPTTASPPRCGRRMSARAMAVAARLQYGCTWINCHFMLTNEMPHGGFKKSGYGKDLSDLRAGGLHGRAARDGEAGIRSRGGSVERHAPSRLTFKNTASVRVRRSWSSRCGRPETVIAPMQVGPARRIGKQPPCAM